MQLLPRNSRRRTSARQAARDLARHKRFTTPRALVVEQHPVAGNHPETLADVHRDPLGIKLLLAQKPSARETP